MSNQQHSRVRKLEGRQPIEPVENMKVIIHSDLAEGEEPTDVITIIEHIDDEPEKPNIKTRSK